LHQSKFNSGVIHAGIYYAPGSLRAKLCVKGAKMLYRYCEEHKIPFKKIGKLIVAVKEEELSRLEKLYQRGLENGVEDLKILEASQIKALEPHVKGLRAIHSPHSGIVDYGKVCEQLAKDFESFGGSIQLNSEAMDFQKYGENDSGQSGVLIVSSDDAFNSKKKTTVQYMISCAGLYSDRIAMKTGGTYDPGIVPVRGEWRLLKRDYNSLVHHLIYPVPDPRYPWLGVHFTPKLNGDVWIGPNAVISTAREGYNYRTVNLLDIKEALMFRGFRALLRKNIMTGVNELYRSLLLSPYVSDLKEYIPEIEKRHIESGVKIAGVRAQALDVEGNLVDDFVFESGAFDWKSVLHVRNAPSPAATSSLAIAEVIVDMAEKNFLGLMKRKSINQ